MRLRMTVPGSTPFPLMINGVYVSSGRTETRRMSKSSTITNPDWLHNSHAGELLLSEFPEPLSMSLEALAAAIDVPVARVEAVIEGSQPMDADLDLRLGRYLRMSEGF